MNNWKTLKEETPTECAICLITVNGNVTLATYSEGEFIQHGNDERHYNNVSAWQYTDPPYNNAKSKFEGGLWTTLEMTLKISKNIRKVN